jgi:hypothetical protein
VFEVLPADFWFPIRRDHKVTVHLGSTSLEARTSGPGGAYLDRLGVGTWDVRSLFHVYQYLNATTAGRVVFEYSEHTEDLHDPTRVDALFQEGNHLIFGSPIVNPIAEDAVCRALKARPRQSVDPGVFPYRFRWDRAKESAFGEADVTRHAGILAGDGSLIARRTVISAGEDGEDCGLILTYRHNPRARPGKEPSPDDDSIVIAIMGHSGCGTFAGTQLVCSDDAASELYPARPDAGTLRAFRVTYRRREPSSGFDNREIVSYALLPNA